MSRVHNSVMLIEGDKYHRDVYRTLKIFILKIVWSTGFKFLNFIHCLDNPPNVLSSKSNFPTVLPVQI